MTGAGARRPVIYALMIVFPATIYLNLFYQKTAVRIPREPLAAFPRVLGAWSSGDQFFPSGILQNLGVDEYLMRRFTDGRDSIWLYIGYYKAQGEGAVPHSPRHCYPGSGFTKLKNDTVTLQVKDGTRREITPNRYVFAKGDQRELVIYWYQSRGRVIADEYVDRMYIIYDSIFRNRSDGALVRLSMRATAATEKSAMQILESFTAQVYPYIPRVIPD